MIKRIIKQTTKEYNEDGVLIREQIVETTEEEDCDQWGTVWTDLAQGEAMPS